MKKPKTKPVPKTDGLHTYRFRDNPEERRFAEAWAKNHTDRLNSTLAWLLVDYESDENKSRLISMMTLRSWYKAMITRTRIAALTTSSSHRPNTTSLAPTRPFFSSIMAKRI